MQPDGVAIFFRDDESGEERPVEFAWGTGADSLAKAWGAAVQKLSARDSAELRSEGYRSRLVSLTPLADDAIEESDFIASCLRHVEVDIERSECTSHVGNEVVTEVLLDATLATDTVRVPVSSDEAVLPEFTADYVDYEADGVVELSLSFTLQSLTATHAIFKVEDLDQRSTASPKGKMAPSSRSLANYQALRKHG